MAKLVFPKSHIRRADVFVATLQIVWAYGWMMADFVQRAIGTRLPPLSLGLVLFVLGANSINVPFLLGVAKGRRWGFVGVAILSAWGALAEITHPPAVGKPVTSLHIAFAALDAASLVYCLVRLRQNQVEGMNSFRTSFLRIMDAVVGTLSVAWMLALLGGLVWAMPHTPLRPFDRSLLLSFGTFGLAYGSVAIGIVLGKRWGLVLMAVLSVLILVVESKVVFSWRPGTPMVEIVMAAFSVVTLAYSAIRLLLRKPLEIRTAVSPPH